MALVYSSLSKPRHGLVKVDIVCVPAIGAEPRKIWTRHIDGDGFEHQRLDFVFHDKLYPNAQVHLYDHFTPDERKVEVIPPRGLNDIRHEASAKAFAAAEARIAEYGVGEWTDRFLVILHEHRRAHRTSQRPILFVCHSTGGTVIKQALNRRPTAGQSDIATICLGVTFFATPHHGSSVLSEPEYANTVQENLGLKWKMSQNLRQEFLPRNTALETLNKKFAVSIIGVKVHNYVEGIDTNLTILSNNDTGVESLTTIQLLIVDSRSGRFDYMSEVPLEEEDVIQLRTTHVGAPRFEGEDTLWHYYIDEITAIVKGYRPDESAAYHALKSDIMTGVEVDVHQFYESTQGMKIVSAHPCLRSFLELGPTKCMEDRLRGIDGWGSFSSDGSIRPMIDITRASEPAAPTLMVTAAGTDEASDAPAADLILTPAATAAAPPKDTSTKLPSISVDLADPEAPRHLAPTPKGVQFRGTSNEDTGIPVQKRRPHSRRLFPLPGPSSDRFKWIHVPFSHTGWVPHVLTTISQEKGDLSLHVKLLMDKMWISQHNRPVHASPHARFVRPSVRCLLPRDFKRSHRDGIATPSSETGDIQVVAYLPYLHWDSFKNLQKREAVIERRKKQSQAYPIAKEVAHGWSMELKVIWQHLTSDRPVHCRRTLDQYGNPHLRNTSYRDQNQTLYKRTKAEEYVPPAREQPSLKHIHWSSAGLKSMAADIDNEADANAACIDETAKVLMVDQLWLWIMDNQTVVTFFASKEKGENGNGLWRDSDLRSEIYQDVNGNYPNQCHDPYDFAALVVFHAIKAFPERAADPNLQVFRIFEEYISILTESQTDSFRQFRDNQRFSIAKDRSALPYFDNRKELDALLELHDVDDELTIITKLIKEQQTCLSDMISQYHHLNTCNKGLNGINFLAEVQQSLNEQREQINGMLKTSQATQTAFKELLDMKQKHAIRISQEQTERAADSSRSIMVFTVFTIIFSPLSFFASVFGINAREWSGVETNPSLRNVFAYMVSISFAFILLALLLAFNKNVRRLSQTVWRSAALPILGLVRLLCYYPRRWHHVVQVSDVEKPAASIRKRR